MIYMNIAPNDFLSIAKVFNNRFSYTTHWSYNKQALKVLKWWKHLKWYICFEFMFPMFQVTYAHELMNDAHEYEMQVQLGKNNTRGVTGGILLAPSIASDLGVDRRF